MKRKKLILSSETILLLPLVELAAVVGGGSFGCKTIALRGCNSGQFDCPKPTTK